MKKNGLLVVATVVALIGFTLFLAHNADASDIDVVKYENKKGTVTFNHPLHQEKLVECVKCHEGVPEKIEVDKTFGHKTCKACHKEMKEGPTKCNACHVKD
jgi:hypothetical protein